MQQELLARAATLGEPIVQALKDVAQVHGSLLNPVYLTAVLDALRDMPDLRDTAFGPILMCGALNYESDARAGTFAATLRAAVHVCEPKSLEVLAQFVAHAHPIHHNGAALMRPDMCSGLALLTVLAMTGLHPKSEAALLNCCKLLMAESVSFQATLLIGRTVERMPDAFTRAAAGEPISC